MFQNSFFTLLFTLLLAATGFSQPTIVLNEFATGFSSPVDIAHAGDSRLFVVEQAGNIRIVDSLGNKLTTPFLTKSVTSGGERGLLGLVFDPNYATNGYFYIYYSQNSNSIISRMSVSAADPNVADPASEVVILTIAQPFSNHNGGDLAFGPDGYLYIGLGDGGSGGDPGNRSQNPQEMLGKMLRIDVATLPYTIPTSNPFVGDPTTLDEIWALGLRNPWRWSFDRLTGDLWIADVGQGSREEINFTPAGSPGGINYGWRCYEGNQSHNTSGCGPSTDYEFPIHDYPRSSGASVTGGFVYRGQRNPELQGIYFMGDYDSERLWGIWPDSTATNGWAVSLLMNTPHQWSTFGEDAAGELYAASYNFGNIYRIDGVCADVSVELAATPATCATAQNGTIDLDLNGVSGLSVLWSTGDTGPSLSNLAPGTYSVTVSNGNGCVITDSVVVAAATLSTPEITPQSTLQACVGSSVVLLADTAPAGLGYQWLLNGSALAGITSQSLTVQTPGDYQVTWTGPCEADTSAIATVQILPVPGTPALSGTTSGTYCPNPAPVIRAATAPVGFAYQWFLDGSPIAGAQADSVLVNAAGDYTVQYTGPCTSATSDVVSISLEAAPAAPVFTTDSVSLCGELTTLLQAPAAPSGYGYQWYLDGTAIVGADQDTYEASESGDYALVFTGGCPSALSEAISVLFNNLSVPPINQNGDTLSTALGVSWQWYLNGNPINGANTATYVATTSGMYTVEVTNELGCSGTSEALTVTLTSLEAWLAGGSVRIAPNPANERVEIRFELLRSARLELSLTDLQGRALHTQLLNATSGEVRSVIETGHLPAGTYLIRLQGESLRYVTRLVVE